MTQIVIEIENCSKCPHFEENNYYSTDGFDSMWDWYCKKEKKVIGHNPEWSQPKPEIPEWCPCKIKAK